MAQPINVFLADSSETIEVRLTSWDKHAENGTGVLVNGKEVTVFTSYDGDGYLVLSDQDTERYLLDQGDSDWEYEADDNSYGTAKWT